MADRDDPETPEPSIPEKIQREFGVDLDYSRERAEELEPPDWITDLDREICRLLSTGLILTPTLIAKNLDRPSSSVSRRLNTLEAGGIVEKIERGHYVLTEEGFARLTQKVPVEVLDTEPSAPEGFVTYEILLSSELENLEEIEED